VSGHFGEWLQGRLGPNGPLALISVPCPLFHCDVTVEDAEVTSFQGHGITLKADQIEALFGCIDVLSPKRITVNSSIPVRAGLGASTASILGVLRALTNDALFVEKTAEICVTVEGATDPLMHDQFDRLLWASRSATLVERLPAPPQYEFVGGLWGEGQATDPADLNFPDISDLVDDWRRAVESSAHEKVAALATESAIRTTERRGPKGDPSQEIAREIGAMGYVRAHTGSARGFLFLPDQAPASVLTQLAEAGYTNTCRFVTGA
jgi:uncharacterized protein involved in propanediol utilization